MIPLSRLASNRWPNILVGEAEACIDWEIDASFRYQVGSIRENQAMQSPARAAIGTSTRKEVDFVSGIIVETHCKGTWQSNWDGKLPQSANRFASRTLRKAGVLSGQAQRCPTGLTDVRHSHI